MDIEKQQYIRKMENEMKLNKKMAVDPKATKETSRTLKYLLETRAKIEDMIDCCHDNQKKLEHKLKISLAECRSLSKNQKELKSEVTMSHNKTRIV